MPRHSRIVVTGGAGFIGSHLVDLLLGLGNTVIAIDDFSTGSRENLAQHQDSRKLGIEDASVLDEQAMASLIRGADFVFHLATRNVRLSLRQPTQVHEVNTTGTLNVLKAAAAAKVRRFLYCSSSEVNGSAGVVPMPEDYLFRPETIYGASKLAGEYYTQVFERAGWLRTTIARPHNTYGPREHYADWKGEVIPRFILWGLAGRPLRIFGDGTQTRDFTYVADTVEILADMCAAEAAAGATLNICRGDEISVNELARLVVELTGGRSRIEHARARPSDVQRLFGDTSRLRKVLGKAPAVPIRDGLGRTVDWFRNHVQPTPAVLDSLEPENWMQLPAEAWMRAP